MTGNHRVKKINQTRSNLQKKAEEELRQTRKEWEEIFQAIGHPALILDAQHRILKANRATLQAVGISEEELQKKKCFQVFHNSQDPPQGCPLDKMLHSGKMEAVEMEIEGFDGTFLVSCTPVLDEKGRLKKIIHIAMDISDRRQAEQALGEEKEKFKILVEGSPFGVALIDKEGVYQYINPKFVEIFGYTLKDIPTGQDWFIKAFPEKNLRKKVIEAWEMDLTEIGAREFPHRIFKVQCKDGSRKWIHFRPVSLGEGTLLVTFEDISDRKRAEEERDRLFNHSLDMLCVAGFDGYLKQVNPAWEKTLGWTREELLSKPFLDFVHPEDQESTMGTVRDLEKGLSILTFQNRYRCRDGSFKWISWNSFPLVEEKLVFSVARDVSRSKEIEATLQKEKHFVESTINSLPGIFYLFDLKGHFLRWNRNLEIVSGYSYQEISRMNPLDFFREKERDLISKRIQDVFLKGQTSVEGLLVTKEGTKIPYFFSGVPFSSENQTYLVGMGIDLSERKRLEETIRGTEEKITKAFRASPHWISISGLEDGRYIEVNDAFSKITGYTREEVLGRTSLELGIWVDPDKRDAMIQILKQKGSISDLEVTFRTKMGEILTVERSAEKLNLDGEDCLISINHDITQQRKLEEQLRQAQKMEAVGRLAGGIAHDFNNILTAILGYTDLILVDLKPQDPMRNEIKEIQKAGQRAASLTQQLLAFSRKQMLQMVPLNLNTLINNLKNMLLRVIGEDIELVTLLAADLGQVKADTGQVEQVIMNLAINARDAMPQGGKMTLVTENILLDQTFVRHHPGAFEGQAVMLALKDTGCGMDAEILSHIYEPFFTTKEVGKGTGLGLSTVYGIVKQSGGYIFAESSPGKGSTFKIFFPRIDRAQGAEGTEETFFPSSSGSGVILVVEDDILVRELIRKILTINGYTVLEAKNGEDALRICQDYLEKIDLLTTDVVMPGLSGPDLAKRIMALRPGIKVIYMSGYSDTIFPQYGILYKGSNFIRKPFTPNDLVQKVRGILA